MVTNIQEHPNALEPFMRHRQEIATQYPDLFLELVKTVQLAREDSLVPAGSPGRVPPTTVNHWNVPGAILEQAKTRHSCLTRRTFS